MAKNILKASDIKGVYKPTAEERANLIPSVDEFVLSGDAVFHTIQGEGNWIGKPTTFVRLHFCNARCSWCDSWYTRHTGTKEFYSEATTANFFMLDTLIKDAQKEVGLKHYDCKNVCFTGWEPLLQQEKIVKFMLLYPEYKVSIETNGTIMPNEFLLKNAKFNCSPKLSNSGNKAMQKFLLNIEVLKAIATTNQPCFKFVCNKIKDFQEIEEKVGNILSKDEIYIMPEWVLIEENIKVYNKIIGKIVSSGYSTTPRIQNVCFNGGTRRR